MLPLSLFEILFEVRIRWLDLLSWDELKAPKSVNYKKINFTFQRIK